MTSDINREPVRVAIDVMGGDYAPQEIVKGAIQAVEQDGNELILVGSEDAIRKELEQYDVSDLPFRVVNASEAIRDGESPVAALRQKPDASVLVAMRLVKEGQADAVVSMGHTGAVMVSAIKILGKLEGVKRPSVGSLLGGFAPNTVAFDLGSNSDCKPRDLVNFAIIGSVVARKLLHINNPTIALLSNGSEEGKGNKLVRETYQLLKQSSLNFIGNVEGNNVLQGKANVIVCDGFIGNILLKFWEGLGNSTIEWLRTRLGRYLTQKEIDAIGNDLFALTHIADVSGGAMIYGVNGMVWIGHGRSKAPEVAESIRQTKLAVEANFLGELKSELGKSQ